MDRVTKEQRSRNMSAIKSRGNLTTEIALVKYFKENKVKGWRRHYKRIIGNLDFVFLKYKIAIFVDGCFWHGCKRHGVLPKSNSEFWNKKIIANQKRDRLVNKALKLNGWSIIRVWEHDLKKAHITAKIKALTDSYGTTTL